MSRSRKKHPIHKDHSINGKRLANKTVRRFIKKLESVPEGKWYRRIYDSWNITDWVYRPTDEYWVIKFKRK